MTVCRNVSDYPDADNIKVFKRIYFSEVNKR